MILADDRARRACSTALRSLLAAKGIATRPEIAERIAITDAATPGRGAAMVAKAWVDPDFRAQMLADGAQAAESLGIPMRGMPPLGVLENTPDAASPRRLHACAAATRARCWAIRPSGSNRRAIAPAPCAIRAACWPNGARCCRQSVTLRVVDSTADYRWMVLPMRPAGTEGWPEDRLAALVREGDMIGVTVPEAP